MLLLFLSIFFWLHYWPSKFFVFRRFLSFFVFLVPPRGPPFTPLPQTTPKIKKYIAIPLICHLGEHSKLENYWVIHVWSRHKKRFGRMEKPLLKCITVFSLIFPETSKLQRKDNFKWNILFSSLQVLECYCASHVCSWKH